MEQVLENPFRVLGLPVSASDRQIAKRVMEAETYLEMGKPLRIDGDYPWLPPMTRNAQLLKEAQGRLHRQEDRCYWAMFWFHGHDPVDQLALEVLQAGQVDKAISLLGKVPSVSNLINLYVLNFALAGTPGPAADDRVMSGLGFAGQAFCSKELSSFFQNLQWNHFKHERVMHEIQEFALDRVTRGQKLLKTPSQEIRRFVSSISHFPQAGRDWLHEKFLSECREVIEPAVSECKEARKEYPEDGPTNAKVLMDACRPVLSRLELVLQSDDPRLALLSDQVAQEIYQCSIDYHNYVLALDEEEQPSLSFTVDLEKAAAEIAKGPVLKRRIQDGLPGTIKFAENQEEGRKIGPSIKEIFRHLETLPKPGNVSIGRKGMLATDVNTFLTRVKGPLDALRQLGSPADSTHLEMSSLIVQVSLSLLIDYADYLLERRDMAASTYLDNMNNVLKMMDLLATYRLEPKVRERLDTNRQILRRNIGLRAAQNNKSSCYVATCVYGDSMAPEVIALRRFRDLCLQNLWLGRVFIDIYYRIGPLLANHLGKYPRLQMPVRWFLDRLAKRWHAPGINIGRNFE